MASTMDHSAYTSSRCDEEPEFNLREWHRKARISRENVNSRRFSASYVRSFREEATSFRSNITISSTVSSPGYPFKDEIDPSTYSFTTALKALQAKAVYNSWDWMTPDGFRLNSKWNEAEKYISNPLSGEVPMECLSAKTLSARSFRHFTNRITMSAPLVYPSGHSRPTINTKPDIRILQVGQEDQRACQVPIREKRIEGMKRDVGTQSTPADLSSGSPSPAPTPPITERSLKRHVEAGDLPFASALKLEDEEKVKFEVEEKEEKGRGEKEGMRDETMQEKEGKRSKSKRQGGCLSWMRKRQREKHEPRKNIFLINIPHLKSC